MRGLTSAPMANSEIPNGLAMPFDFETVGSMAPGSDSQRYPCTQNPQRPNYEKDLSRWDQGYSEETGASNWPSGNSMWGVSSLEPQLDVGLGYDMSTCLDMTSPTLSTMSFGTNSGMPSALFSPLSLLSETPSDLSGQMSLLPTPSTTPVSVSSVSSSGQIFPAPANTPIRTEPVAPPPPPPPPLPSTSVVSTQCRSSIPGFSVPLSVSLSESTHSSTAEPVRKTPTAKRVGTNQCETCGKLFQRTSELSKHRRYHLKDHKCTHNGCEAAFSTRKDLKRHINSAHSTSKTGHVCRMPGCGKNVSRKVYNRSDNFLRHLRTAHFHEDIDVTNALRTWLDDGPGSNENNEAE
ncbi:hypothetical protein CFIMG_002950RA [Ceratocystis fimbriata CBS 114723]|uniref:C2H2-type domain-containing protein n=1 Tax=Ceratocystis fimbriata CBS 114723 TaxID=1035309 RepID=A0A2C5WVZ3_9PEZI|nr:hypothetical protein CFIMG_002950RA [Ceratocystis fimbriata CBS 114723]